MANHYDFGRIAEQLAANYLKDKGYTILTQNYRYLKAEIDVIAKYQNTLAIVEVKARNNPYFGNPLDAVTVKKIKLMVQAANEYVLSNDLDVDLRFDVVAIIKRGNLFTIEHIEDAFYYF